MQKTNEELLESKIQDWWNTRSVENRMNLLRWAFQNRPDLAKLPFQILPGNVQNLICDWWADEISGGSNAPE